MVSHLMAQIFFQETRELFSENIFCRHTTRPWGRRGGPVRTMKKKKKIQKKRNGGCISIKTPPSSGNNGGAASRLVFVFKKIRARCIALSLFTIGRLSSCCYHEYKAAPITTRPPVDFLLDLRTN